jgi:hypothetical protein
MCPHPHIIHHFSRCREIQDRRLELVEQSSESVDKSGGGGGECLLVESALFEKAEGARRLIYTTTQKSIGITICFSYFLIFAASTLPHSMGFFRHHRWIAPGLYSVPSKIQQSKALIQICGFFLVKVAYFLSCTK